MPDRGGHESEALERLLDSNLESVDSAEEIASGMAQLAGFELEARDADWAGAEFAAESRSHVSVYRLPAVS